MRYAVALAAAMAAADPVVAGGGSSTLDLSALPDDSRREIVADLLEGTASACDRLVAVHPAAGDRRAFLAICGDGSAWRVRLHEDGSHTVMNCAAAARVGADCGPGLP